MLCILMIELNWIYFFFFTFFTENLRLLTVADSLTILLVTSYQIHLYNNNISFQSYSEPHKISQLYDK